jgi:hypothetical protein
VLAGGSLRACAAQGLSSLLVMSSNHYIVHSVVSESMRCRQQQLLVSILGGLLRVVGVDLITLFAELGDKSDM